MSPLIAYGLGVGKDQIWVVGLFDKKKKKSACEIRSLKWSIRKMKKGIENGKQTPREWKKKKKKKKKKKPMCMEREEDIKS